jgi:hypothetical protein
MAREDYIKELEKQICHKVERKLGSSIQNILLTYKNLPYLNSFTRNQADANNTTRIYKYEIERWLDEIEKWIFQTVIQLEPQIIFSIPPKQYI